MSLAKQPLFVTFKSLEQRKGQKYLQPGKLLEAQDVCQRQQGRYEQRPAFYNAPNFIPATSSVLSSAVSLSYNDVGMVLRTPARAYQLRAGYWYDAGATVPVSARETLVNADSPGQPVVVAAGGYYWHFMGSRMFVTDATTGAIVRDTTLGAGVATTAVYDGTYVNIFWRDTVNIYTMRWPANNPAFTPGAFTTAAVISGAATVTGMDAVAHGGYVLILVSGTALVAAGTSFVIGRINISTGVAAASLAYVGASGTRTKAAWIVGPNEGTGATRSLAIYYGSLNPAQVRVVDYTTATNTVAADTLITTVVNALGNQFRFAIAPVRDASGNLYVNIGDGNDPAGSGSLSGDPYVIQISKPSSGGATTATLFRGQYPASRPFVASNGDLLFVAGNGRFGLGDGNNIAPQSAYFLRNAVTGGIIGRAQYGNGGDAAMIGGIGSPSDWLSPVSVVGSVAVLGAIATNEAKHAIYTGMENAKNQDFRQEWTILDPAIGPMLAGNASHGAVLPGAWPQMVGRRGIVQELVLPEYPGKIGANSGSGNFLAAGQYSMTACYVRYESNGDVWRSSPAPTLVFTSVGANYTLNASTLRAINDNTDVWVEFYLSKVGDVSILYVGRVRNDLTIDLVAVNATAFATLYEYNEPLYTTGGALVNTTALPCTWAAEWRGRVFAGQGSRVGYTQDQEVGLGLRFNGGVLFLDVLEGTGDTTAGGTVDANYFAVFKADGIWVISGFGPDGQGSGNYVLQRLPTTIGCTNPASVVTSPQGVWFQGTDGRIYVLGRDLKIVPAGRGVDSHKWLVTAALHVPVDQHVRFWNELGECLVFDYGNPPTWDDELPFGQWYTWTALAAGAAVGATVLGGFAYHILSNGAIYVQANASAYADSGSTTPGVQRLQLAPVQFGGVPGYGRVWRGVFLGGGDVTRITCGGNHDTGAAAGTWDFRPSPAKALELAVDITRTGTTTGAWYCDGLEFDIGVKGGARANSTGRI